MYFYVYARTKNNWEINKQAQSTADQRKEKYGTVLLVSKPRTPEKISGMLIVLRPIRCEMKPAKDNQQTAVGISHDLIRNKSWPFLPREISNFPFVSLWKSYFYCKATLVTWFRLFKSQTTELI